MFDLVDWGENFIKALGEVGDWLIYTPPDWVIPLSELTDGQLADIVFHNPFGSIGSSLLGVGLLGILSFKVVKFVTDLVL